MVGFEAAMRKRAAVKEAEKQGEVADSMDVRKVLMARVHSGEITLEQAQKELAKIKRSAGKNGQITRAQAFRHG